MIVDGHEDLALNVLADGRDYLTSASAIRESETASGVESACGLCMLGLEDWRNADVRVIVAALQAIPREHAEPGCPSYVTAEAAYRQARAQLEIYHDWADENPQIRILEAGAGGRAAVGPRAADRVRPPDGERGLDPQRR
jgi:hypothetical protein